MTSELNPRFDFDSFKVGAGNELALTAARSVAERPGSVYNPLYVHGSAGLGKTHLLMAIGRYAQRVGEAVQRAPEGGVGTHGESPCATDV